MRSLLSRLRDDEGLTLVELIVAMVLASVLGAIVSTAVLISHKQVRIAEDEATGLSDTRVVIERLGRDIRGSRGVDVGATTSNLVLWIDNNSDYVRNVSSQPDEIVTWSVVDNSGVVNTLRQTAGGTVQVQARTLVNTAVFCYKVLSTDTTCLATPLSATDAARTRLVQVTLTYNSNIASDLDDRTTTFTERIRNVS